MADNMYDALDEGSSEFKASGERRTASLAALHDDQGEQLLADVARAKAEGLNISPTLTMACGYAEGYRDAAKKTGQN